jgi:hypothetical protein
MSYDTNFLGSTKALHNPEGDNMETHFHTHKKGRIVAVMLWGTTVEIWVASPTGDSSDSHTFTIPCLTEAQAETVAQLWRTMAEAVQG